MDVMRTSRNGFLRHWLFRQESCGHVCFSCFESPCLCLSLLLSPLCLSPAPSALGPPHQSSHFLPSPSHLTTQQVEHWLLRTLLWPGSPCPEISMVCPAQALLPAGITHPTPTLWPCWARVLGWLPVQLTSLLRSAMLSSLLAFPPALAAIASALLGACTLRGWEGSHQLPSSRPSRRGGCMCPAHLYRPQLPAGTAGWHAAWAPPGQLWCPVCAQDAERGLESDCKHWPT